MIRHNGITIDSKLRMVWHRGEARRLSKGQFKLVSAILLAGPGTSKEITAIIYRDDPNGGPLWINQTFYVQLLNVRRIIRAIGLEIRSERCCGLVRYSLAPSSIENFAEAA
jgi:hypothetical protein